MVKVPGDAEGLLEELRREKIIGGLHLGEFYPELANHLLLCFTELVSRARHRPIGGVCRRVLQAPGSLAVPARDSFAMLRAGL